MIVLVFFSSNNNKYVILYAIYTSSIFLPIAICTKRSLIAIKLMFGTLAKI